MNYEREVATSEPEFTLFLQDFVNKDIFRKNFQTYRRLFIGQCAQGDSYQMAMYCLEHMKSLKQYDLEIWPGLRYAIRKVESGIPMLNLDTDYLIVRLETAFDLMQDIKKDLPLAGKNEL